MDLGGIFSPLMSKPQNWGGFTIIVRSIKITMQNTFYGIIDVQLQIRIRKEKKKQLLYLPLKFSRGLTFIISKPLLEPTRQVTNHAKYWPTHQLRSLKA